MDTVRLFPAAETFAPRVGCVKVTTATGAGFTYPNVPEEDALAVREVLRARLLGQPCGDWIGFRNENGEELAFNLNRLIAASVVIGMIDPRTIRPAQPALMAPALPEGGQG